MARTGSVSGAFVKELMRQAALRATLEERAPVSAALDDPRRSFQSHAPALGQPGDEADGEPPMPEMMRAIEAAGLPLRQAS